MNRLITLLLLFSTTAFAAGSGGVNAPEHRDKPTVILVSIDGFRWDYRSLTATPTLDRIAAEGVTAERMIPVFPTLTFPNHYSIATGLYPDKHGIIGNYFPSRDRKRFYSLRNREEVQDGSWYGGEPVWVAAEKAGMVTAAYFFVGTEAPIDGVPMTYWHDFNAAVPGRTRVNKALEWLAMPDESRPHLITLYFEHVDTLTHRFGPGSKPSLAAIERVDGYLGALLEGIDALPNADDVYVVVVSDHGQGRRVDGMGPFFIDSVVDLDQIRVVDHGASAFLYFAQPDPARARNIVDAINAEWRYGKAILREDLPASWRASADAGFAEIVAQADPGYLVYSTRERARGTTIGDHGWARESEDMHGIFMASGARLPAGESIGPVDAVDIYPLLMEILGLPITTPIDGDPALLPALLSE